MRAQGAEDRRTDRETTPRNDDGPRCARTYAVHREAWLHVLYERFQENEKWKRPSDVSAPGCRGIGPFTASPGRISFARPEKRMAETRTREASVEPQDCGRDFSAEGTSEGGGQGGDKRPRCLEHCDGSRTAIPPVLQRLCRTDFRLKRQENLHGLCQRRRIAPSRPSCGIPDAHRFLIGSMKRIAVIPGDGIGIDVTRESLKVLKRINDVFGKQLEFVEFDWGADKYLREGVALPEGALEMLRKDFDAILFGAIGDPRVPNNKHAAQILLAMRFGLDLYANVRPIQLFHEKLCPLKGVTPRDVNFTVIRENT